MLLLVKPTPAPHSHTGAPQRVTQRRAHIVGITSGYDSPFHTISSPSVLHHLIWRFGRQWVFPWNTYVGLVCHNMSYDVNTFWRLRWWFLFPEKTTWDLLGQGNLQRVNKKFPRTKHLLRTAQTNSSRPDNYWSLPLLHPPVDRGQHSPSLNLLNENSSSKNPLYSMPFTVSGRPSEEHEGKHPWAWSHHGIR